MEALSTVTTAAAFALPRRLVGLMSHLAARLSEVLRSLVLGASHLGRYLAACFSLTSKMGPKGETTIAATSTAVSGVPHPSP